MRPNYEPVREPRGDPSGSPLWFNVIQNEWLTEDPVMHRACQETLRLADWKEHCQHTQRSN